MGPPHPEAERKSTVEITCKVSLGFRGSCDIHFVVHTIEAPKNRTPSEEKSAISGNSE